MHPLMTSDILTQGLTNLQQSLENWSQNYLTPGVLSFGSYLMMFFLFFLFLSVFLIVKGKFKGVIEWTSRHLLGTAFVLWLMGVVIYIVGFYHDQLNALAIVPRAIVSSFKMFVVSNDLARVQEVLRKDAVYMTVFSLVHFISAFITFLFIFKMVGYKIKSSLNIMLYKWFRAKGRKAHVFWGVNEASMLLAEDIRKNGADDTIIFIDVDKESDENSQKKTTMSYITNTITVKNSEIVRMDDIQALVDHCFNGPAALMKNSDIFGTLRLENVSQIVKKSSRTSFYFFSDDEEQNVLAALNLQHDRRLGAMEKKPVIYVHARKSANNEVVDHYQQYDSAVSGIEIKIVDSACLSIEKLKQDTWMLPVDSVVYDTRTGLVESPFTAMIVGFGGTGLEAFKFLYEYAAFVGTDGKKSPFKCYAIDRKMNQLAGVVRSKMPAIREDELVLIKDEVDSEPFWDRMKTVIDELDYVVISLNDDSVGLSLAVNLFKFALAHRRQDCPILKILIRCYANGTEWKMQEVIRNLNHSVSGEKVELRLFGKERELYTCDMILSERVLKNAKEFNRVYERSEVSADEQWKRNFGEEEMKRLVEVKGMSRYHAIYDINRRINQNFSNVLHGTTKRMLMGLENSSDKIARYCEYVDTRKPKTVDYLCDRQDAELLLNLAKVEHERWVASHKLMGYVYHEVNDCVQKHHRCICDWNDLDEETQSYDCDVVDTTIRLACQKR